MTKHRATGTAKSRGQEFLFTNSDVYAGPLPVAQSAAAAPVLTRVIPKLSDFKQHENESEDLKRIRSYEIRAGGKAYRIYRGDIHRHTELSMDGNNDGSLFETYRYAFNAASLDFLGVFDHNGAGGPDVEYVRYLGHQAADLFRLRPAFVPLFAWERSVAYPNGHRNILFAQRGVPTLPISPGENKGATGA